MASVRTLRRPQPGGSAPHLFAGIRKCIDPPKWRPCLRAVGIPSEHHAIPAGKRRTTRICRERAARPSRFRHPRSSHGKLSRQILTLRSPRTTGPSARSFAAIHDQSNRTCPRRLCSEIGYQEQQARWNAEAGMQAPRWHIYTSAMPAPPQGRLAVWHTGQTKSVFEVATCWSRGMQNSA